MDPKEQVRLRMAAQNLIALADGKVKWEWQNHVGDWVPWEVTNWVPLALHPAEWRVAEPVTAEKCEWCDCERSDHGKDWNPCKGFIPASLAGPRPTPPDGCELLAPDEPRIGECDAWFDGSEWMCMTAATFFDGKKFWRARRIAEKAARVSDHEMLVAVVLWLYRNHEHPQELASRFLAQEGGK